MLVCMCIDAGVGLPSEVCLTFFFAKQNSKRKHYLECVSMRAHLSLLGRLSRTSDHCVARLWAVLH